MTGDSTAARLPPHPDGGGEPYAAFTLEDDARDVLPTLVLRRRDGSRVAKPYHWLSEAEYLPDGGVRLVYPDGTFTVRGRNLLPLFTALSRHAVREIWEADRATALLVPEGDPLVEGIDFSLPRG